LLVAFHCLDSERPAAHVAAAQRQPYVVP
jgi:hypothetical protein